MERASRTCFNDPVIRPSLSGGRLFLRAFLVLCPGACAQPQAELPPFELEGVSPKVLTGVYLNEPLVFSFSGELDRASVTRASVRLTTKDGRAARGERLVEKSQLRFLPDPVRAPDLGDGGFRPGETYVVELAGFPRPDGLRSKDGRPLRSTVRFELSTVVVDEPRGGGIVFLDRTTDQGLPMRFKAPTAEAPEIRAEIRMGPTDPIVLEGEEPLDPSSVRAEDFVLRPNAPEKRGELAESIPLTAVLRDNRDKHEYPPRGTTLLHLVPQRPLAPGAYLLTIDPGTLHLRDFSAHPVLVVMGNAPVRRMSIRVSSVAQSQAQGEHLEEFLDTSLRSSALVPSAAGTALWNHSGRVEVRYPAAAGSGIDGDVRLEGREARQDIQAKLLSVPQDVRCELAGEGLVVLRSQGSLEIAGHLVRKGASTPLAFAAPTSLSAWLEEARKQGTSCTVLIAGGDLLLSGELECSGPVVFVAGGRVRVSGAMTVGGEHVPFGELARHGDAGALALCGAGAPSIRAPLAIDPPLANPLVEPVLFAVRSNPIPPNGHVARWHPVPDVSGHSGSGVLRVRYVGERGAPDPGDGARGAESYEVTVDDPALLVDCRTLRLQIELELRPGAVWDPPWLDHVRLSWDEPDPREGR
jgi:hypothetical protein